MAELVVNDINGDFYVAGAQGEKEEDFIYRHVYVLEGDVAVFRKGNAVDARDAGNLAALNRTLKLNYHKLVQENDPNEVSAENARKIAYLRVLALSKGLGDLLSGPAAHNCTRTDLVRVVPTAAGAVPGNNFANDAPIANILTTPVPNWAADAAWRANAKLKFTNMVCTVAYFFRIRGHHWLEDMDARYSEIWKRCLYAEDHAGLEWKFVAHHAFHFIYPDDLDEFWTHAKDHSLCAGTLIKRWSSLPAGVASVGAVSTGGEDLVVVFPAFRDIMPEAFEEVNRCKRAMGERSWVGSVNRRFYNAPDLEVDEKRLGGLASVILCALKLNTTNPKLADSRALQRVAQNAPITGALLVNIMTRAVDDARMVDSLFMEEVPEG
jgi:hypothetical protein